MSILRSEQLVEYAKSEYASGRIDIDGLEDRIHRALTGAASDQEWIDAARHHRFHQALVEQARAPIFYVETL